MATINSGYIKSQLNQFNINAATIGYNRILLLQEGEDNECMIDDAELMTDLIDSINDYSIIFSYANYAFSITSVANGNTLGITINGVDLGTISFTDSSTTDAATAIMIFINSTGKYVATANTNNVVIIGQNGSADNGNIILFTPTGITLNTPLPLTLLGGDDYLNRNSVTCITTYQMQNVLNKLCQLSNRYLCL